MNDLLRYTETKRKGKGCHCKVQCKKGKKQLHVHNLFIRLKVCYENKLRFLHITFTNTKLKTFHINNQINPNTYTGK